MPGSLGDQLQALRDAIKVGAPTVSVRNSTHPKSEEKVVPTLSDQDNLEPLEPPMPGDRTFEAIDPEGGHMRLFKDRRLEKKTKNDTVENPGKPEIIMNIPMVGGGHMEGPATEEQQMKIFEINLRNQRDQRALTLSMFFLNLTAAAAIITGIALGVHAETKKAP
jgi:hypothetical protein